MPVERGRRENLKSHLAEVCHFPQTLDQATTYFFHLLPGYRQGSDKQEWTRILIGVP